MVIVPRKGRFERKEDQPKRIPRNETSIFRSVWTVYTFAKRRSCCFTRRGWNGSLRRFDQPSGELLSQGFGPHELATNGRIHRQGDSASPLTKNYETMSDKISQEDEQCLSTLRIARHYLHLARKLAIEAAELAETLEVKTNSKLLRV